MTSPHRVLPVGLACAVLLGLFLVQGAAFVRSNSQTYDEAGHLAAGYAALARKDFRLYKEHPPLVRELCALPVRLLYRLPFEPDPRLWQEEEMWAIGRDFLYRSGVPAQDILTAARVPNLLLGAVLVGCVACWAYRLWGREAAVLAAALAALEPNFVANACLIGTDMAATLFVFLTMFLLWEYGQRRRTWALVGVGVSLGLALASKYSGLVLLPLVGVFLLGHVALPRSPLGPAFATAAAPAAGLSRRLGQALSMAALIGVAAAAVLLVVYMGQGFGPWVYGVSWQLTKLGQGHPAFFLGEYSDQGWWSYGPVAFLIKTPLGTLVLILAGLALLRAGKPVGAWDILYLLLPVAVFVVAVLRGRVDVGVRYLLPIYPFLIVVASRLAALSWPTGWLKPVVLGAAVAWNGVSVLRVAPHHLAYFNEIVGGPGQGARYLSDSNIDWGQGLVALREFMDREGVPMVYLAYFGTALPEGYGIRAQAVPACGPVEWPRRSTEQMPADGSRELLAVGVTALQATYCKERDVFRWLEGHRPVAKVGYCIYVYDITGNADAHRHLAKMYEKEGWPNLAAAERARAGGGGRQGEGRRDNE